MRTFFLGLFTVMLLLLISCKKDNDIIDTTESDTVNYNPDWTFTSHGKAACNYDVVFPQNAVNTIEIYLGKDLWDDINDDMKSICGYRFGQSGTGMFSGEEAAYVDPLIKFNGKQWKNTGFRLKGNSTLSVSWSRGIYKLPFRLNFDEFEDDYPAIKNQRFYGFKELSFSPGFKDPSLIREKLASDIFRLSGIAVAQSAFYKVYIDFGDGLKYCGIYTAVELPDDNMIEDQIGEDDGNIYKPESTFATFKESEFEKKNNETENDFSDVTAFIAALNSNTRLSDPGLWRTNLEKTFNMDYFIKYLAINNAIVNWDSYGVMAHNYYLYNHSANRLTWIPWDHNESMIGDPGITGTASGGPPEQNHTPLSLSMNEVGAQWALISHLRDDAVYFERYKNYLKWFNTDILSQSAITSMIDTYHELIYPYVAGDEKEEFPYSSLQSVSDFTSSPTQLKQHFTKRSALISSYVP